VASVLLLTDGSHNESRFSYKKLDPLVAESKCSGVYWCVKFWGGHEGRGQAIGLN
jgi:hypothetical protein